jgi:MazG family protein
VDLVADKGLTAGEKFERAVAIMHRLRAPGGCPWDREQSFDTIKPYTLEETYEVLEAIDKRAWNELPSELGDLLLQVLFYAEMASEDGRFSVSDVLDRLSDKLVKRHPHVFGDVQVDTAKDVLRNWEALKAGERTAPANESMLSNVSHAMPALLEAFKISSKVAGVGFDWPDVESLLEKLKEETDELRREIAQLPHKPTPITRGIAGSGAHAIPEPLRLRLEDEVGDMLFVLVNIARYLSLDPESALRKTNQKFRRRFGQVEKDVAASGKKLADASLDEMEAAWQRAKATEK